MELSGCSFGETADSVLELGKLEAGQEVIRIKIKGLSNEKNEFFWVSIGSNRVEKVQDMVILTEIELANKRK
jgi:hypothetical protein